MQSVGIVRNFLCRGRSLFFWVSGRPPIFFKDDVLLIWCHEIIKNAIFLFLLTQLRIEGIRFAPVCCVRTEADVSAGEALSRSLTLGQCLHFGQSQADSLLAGQQALQSFGERQRERSTWVLYPIQEEAEFCVTLVY